MRNLLAALITLVVLLASPAASAHEFRPSVLRLDEVAPGTFTVAWTPSAALAASGVPEPEVEFPAHCRYEAPRLDCGEVGLDGVGFAKLGPSQLDVALQVRWLDGRARLELLDAQRPAVKLADADAPLDATAYLRLGVEHILGGFDHLLFVVGLTLLIGVRRRLLWVVTAFTAGHAIALTCSTFDFIRLPQAPVEAAIALSIVLLATELVREREGLSLQWPAAVALVFGLVHGLGFAGALRAIGLPEESLGLALGAFNIGIELGQLGIVALVVLALKALARADAGRTLTHRVPAYVLGAIGCAWLFERIIAFWGVA